ALVRRRRRAGGGRPADLRARGRADAHPRPSDRPGALRAVTARGPRTPIPAAPTARAPQRAQRLTVTTTLWGSPALAHAVSVTRTSPDLLRPVIRKLTRVAPAGAYV